MSVRTALPQRRPHETFRMSHWGMTFIVGVGRDDDGRVREIFINNGRSGTQAETLARDSAVILSVALQYGVPLDALRHAITRDVSGGASGPIGAILDRLAEGGGA